MVLWRAAIGALSLLIRAPLRSFGLAGLIYLLYPRFASWQIRSLRLTSLWFHVLDCSIDLDLQVGVTVWNPNWVGAYLRNASVELYRVSPATVLPEPYDTEALNNISLPFATAFTKESYQVPPHSSFTLMSHTSIRHLPLWYGLSIVHEIVNNNGVVKVRGVGAANVRAAHQEITVLLDCVQHVNTYRLPARLVHSECSYRLTNRVLTDYIKATGALQPLLVEFFQSFDMSEYEEDSFTPVPIGEDEGTSGVIALVEE